VRLLSAAVVGVLAVVAAAGSATAGALSAGAAAVPLELPPGTPLAGYGGFPRRAWVPGLGATDAPAFWFRPATGIRDALRVRALALAEGDRSLLWLALDVVGVDPRLAVELSERLARGRGRAPSAIIVSASHTHSGPGAYADSELFGLIAVDRPSPEVRGRFLDAMERASRRAEAARAPVLLGAGSVRVRGQNASRIGAAVDEEMTVVKLVTPAGRPVAMLWNFAIHGTALSRRNLVLSADLMGDASARIEAALHAPALFVNGAVADASPVRRDAGGVALVGAALAEAALGSWGRIASAPAAGLDIARRRLELPPPRLSLRSCLGSWIPRGLVIGLDPALPRETEMLAVAVGSQLAAVTIPGELQMALGLEIKAAARAHFASVVVAGLSNDYIGYLLANGGPAPTAYMACGSLYGESGGEFVQQAAATLLHQVSQVPPAAVASPLQAAHTRPGPRGPAKPSARASAPAPTSSGRPCCGEPRPW
jgi:Neutral/alkaline non-lysosomal ceramidase, N-terminal